MTFIKGWIALAFMWCWTIVTLAASFYDNPTVWRISVIAWVISFGAWCYFTYKLLRGDPE